jgi:outer membrane protein OmpU
MNKLKKIGLTALSASLVAISANAGEMSVSGSAKIATEGFTGENQNAGTTFSMGNQLTFSGSGELENGLNVSLSFILDQNDDKAADVQSTTTNYYNNGTPFDSHSVSVGNDSIGTLVFAGEGGSTASGAIDTTAAGDLWDAFDGKTYVDGATTALPDLAVTAAAGDNSIFYTTPELVDGLTLVASYSPQGSNKESASGYGINYTGVEGLSVHYADSDVVGAAAANDGDNTVFKASYAYGPVTVSYSNMEHDLLATANDVEMTSYAISYTVTDSISVTYGNEESKKGTGNTDAEIDGITASYTAGGMTISASRYDAENLAYTTGSDEDMEYWALSASFAF